MNRHEGVSCDSCLKNNFRGRRYKCLICIDYDLCAACYESGATTNQHTTEHPMQCILSRSDFDLYYGGEALTLEQPQAYTCPFCNRMGFTDTALMEHVTAEHADTTLAQVVCPVCASMPGGEPNFVTDDFAGHLTLEHRTGPRDLISFLDEPSGIRHGGVRRLPHSGRGVSRARRTNMQFSTGGGISSLSPSSRDAVVDPIAELLSQLSGVRRAGQPGTPSQLQQLQMQLQLERQQATAARQQLERLPRRGGCASGGAPAPAPAPAAAQPMPPPAHHDSQYLLASFLGGSSEQSSSETESRAALLRGLMLASLGRTPPAPAPPPAAPPAPPAAAPAPPVAQAAPAAPPPAVLRVKPQPRTKEGGGVARGAARGVPEGR